jgi:hypothetical protein
VAGLLGVVPCRGAVETAEAGGKLLITAVGVMTEIPGNHYVVPGLGDDLISFYELEAQGLVYRRHQTRPELREWVRDGSVVPLLTYKVYREANIGLLHLDGAAHEYPEEYPLGAAARAYKLVLRDPVVSLYDLEGALVNKVVLRDPVGPPCSVTTFPMAHILAFSDVGSVEDTHLCRGLVLEPLHKHVMFSDVGSPGSKTPRKE